MRFSATAVAAFITLNFSYSQAQIGVDPAYARTKVQYDRTDVSESSTKVYDQNGNVMGRFFNTPINVPIDDHTIAAAVSPDGSRLMTEVLPHGMLIRNTKNGLMVRVLVSDFSHYQAEQTSFLNKFSTSNLLGTPTEDFYVPLSEFQQGKLKVTGLVEGSQSHASAAYTRFLNAIKEPSGNYVLANEDSDDEAPLAGGAEAKNLSIYPPTCNCVRGSCAITGLFGPRTKPRKEFHKGLDIDGGLGTQFVAPDSVVVSENGWSQGSGGKKSYGWRTVLRSLTYTNPQIYYAFNHQMNKPALSVGQHLQPGDPVGREGRTGYVTGPHLHFEVYRSSTGNGNQIDPLPTIRLNMQRLSKSNTEILSYSCDSLRARIHGGPNQLGSGAGAHAQK